MTVGFWMKKLACSKTGDDPTTAALVLGCSRPQSVAPRQTEDHLLLVSHTVFLHDISKDRMDSRSIHAHDLNTAGVIACFQSVVQIGTFTKTADEQNSLAIFRQILSAIK